MHNKLKALGLSLVAVFAMSAAFATAAHAAEYHAESAPAFFHGTSGTIVFALTHSPENIEFRCGTTEFNAESKAKAEKTITVHPTYANCEIEEIPAKVETKSCSYRFSQPTVLTGGTSWTITTALVNCPSTAAMTIKFSGCTIEFWGETGVNQTVSHIILTNTGTGATRTVDQNITLTAITTKQTSGCPGGAGTFNSDYSGTMELRGYTNAAHTIQQGIWIE